VVPASRVAMVTSLLCLDCIRPPLTYKIRHQFPSSSIGDVFNCTNLLQGRKPGGDQVKILETQPLAIPPTIMKKLQGDVRLTLTHGDLQVNTRR